MRERKIGAQKWRLINAFKQHLNEPGKDMPQRACDRVEEATDKEGQVCCLSVLRGRVTVVTNAPLSFLSKKHRKKKKAKIQADKQGM